MPSVDTVSGTNRNRIIRGPLRWIDDRTGTPQIVYERLKTGRTYTKRQLYTITHDGQGLGRILDERTDVPTRRFEDDIIFPLGWWRSGEKREFSSRVETIAGPVERTLALTVRLADYERRGIPNSLQYEWTSKDAAGQIVHWERYIYSPGKGLVRYTNMLERD
ncbi:MAG: hypothetical protein AAFY56_05480 [Pseudomonadota bacterium]